MKKTEFNKSREELIGKLSDAGVLEPQATEWVDKLLQTTFQAGWWEGYETGHTETSEGTLDFDAWLELKEDL